MTLSTVIQQLRERERARDVPESDRDQMVEDWRQDIRAVHDVIRAALKTYVDADDAKIGVEDVAVSEEMLGLQTYPRLVVEIVGRRIAVTPVARFTIGGSGRLDMYRENRPTEDHRVFIVRGAGVADEDPASWFIEQKDHTLTGPTGSSPGTARGKRWYRPLEPRSIEAAVAYLLALP